MSRALAQTVIFVIFSRYVFSTCIVFNYLSLFLLNFIRNGALGGPKAIDWMENEISDTKPLCRQKLMDFQFIILKF